MRKGHRRTQSAFNMSSGSNPVTHNNQALESNEIMKLLAASENHVASKVINYEKLEIGQENNKYKFGNISMERVSGTKPGRIDKAKHPSEFNLNCIPENSRSSELSSQKLSKQGGAREEDFLPMPKRKVNKKRASDFRRLEFDDKRTAQMLQRDARFGNSLKKR